MKRIIVLLSALLVLSIVFIACNYDRNGAEEDTSAQLNTEEISTFESEAEVSEELTSEPETEVATVPDTTEDTAEAVSTEAVTTEAATTEAATTEAATEAPSGGSSSSGSSSSGGSVGGGSAPAPTPTDPCANGHDEQQHAAKSATCTESGYDAYVTCKREGCNYTTRGADIPALGHNMKVTSAKIEASCTTDGKMAVKSCANGCGKTEGGTVISAKGHSYNAGGVCTICGAEEVPAVSNEKWTVPKDVSVYYATNVEGSVPSIDGSISKGEYGDAVVLASPTPMAKDWPEYGYVIDSSSDRPRSGTIEYYFAYDDENVYIAFKEYGAMYSDGNSAYQSFAARSNYSFGFGLEGDNITNYLSHSVSYGNGCWSKGTLSFSNGKLFDFPSTEITPADFYDELFVHKYKADEASLPVGERTRWVYGNVTSATNQNAKAPYIIEVEMKINKAKFLEYFNSASDAGNETFPDAMYFMMTGSAYRLKADGSSSGALSGTNKYLVSDISKYNEADKARYYAEYGMLADSPTQILPSIIVFDEEKLEDAYYPSQGFGFASNGDGTCYISSKGDLTDTEVVLPEKSPSGELVVGIGNGVFENCETVTSIKIPKSITSIGEAVFKNSSSLIMIEFEGTESEWNALQKGSDWDKNAGADTVNGKYKMLFSFGGTTFTLPSEGVDIYYANDVSNKAAPVFDGVISEGEYGTSVVVVDEPIKMAASYPDYHLKIDDASERPFGGRVEYHFAYDEENIYIAIKEYGQTFDDGNSSYKSFAARNNYTFTFGFDPNDMTNYIAHSVSYGNNCWNGTNGGVSISGGKAYGYSGTGELPDSFYSEIFVNKYPISEASLPSNERNLYAYGDVYSAHNGNANSAYVLELEIRFDKEDVIEFFNKHGKTEYSELPDAMWFSMMTNTFRVANGSGSITGYSKYLVNDIREYDEAEKSALFGAYGGLTNSKVEYVPSLIVFGEKGENIVIPSTIPCADGHYLTSHNAKAPTCEAVGWNAYESCIVCNYSTLKILSKTSHIFDDVSGKCSCGIDEDEASAYNGVFKAGYAREDITPIVPIKKKDGSSSYSSVNDKLYITTIAVSDGEEIALLVTVDVTSIGADNVKSYKKCITNATGVPAENIIISATHTHTAPTPGIPSTDPNNMRWMVAINGAMANSAKRAIADMTEAEIYTGTKLVEGMAFVRRWINKDGTPGGIWRGYNTDRSQIERYETDADNSVQIIRFVREDKKDIVMANLQTHFTSAGSYVEGISADLGDILRAEVEKNDDDALFAVYLGASGNITPIAYISSLKKYSNYKTMGVAVANVIVDATPDLVKVEAGKIQTSAITVTTNVRKEDAATVENAKKAQAEIKALNQYDGNEDVYNVAAKYGFVSAKEVNSIVSRNTSYGETRNHNLGAISFGDLAFVSAPYEMFDTNGMQIKDGSPFDMTFVITNAGGAGAYVPSAIAVPNGGYEVYTAVDEFGTAERMVLEFLKMLNEHKASK